MDKSVMSESLEGIAIIGMVGRFPGAKNVDEFWQNLKNGVESISFFSDRELEEAGIDRAVFSEPHYVRARAVLEDIELFDASFFGFNPREAAITDPQHRLFLECAWEALESAGYNAETYEGSIGVYGGSSGINTYFLNNLHSNGELRETVGDYQIFISNDKDFLSTRVSYKLNLKGPSVTVQTACSTSLVAIGMACQSLLNYQCDMALAGASAIGVPQKAGYLYQEGMILSPDGHCRPFDAKAEGTLGGSGVGIVVLKRLEDAIADGDYIHAVIKGSAINNDGSLKIGYTAPSIDGQAEAIAQALATAEFEPETVSYIEAHGTGTPLGDPIEIAALTQVFRAGTQKKGFCAIGSVKSNLGHLDTASGVTGLIKTVQALKHKLLPPSLHFEVPNPKIDFANSPFYVNATLSEWKTNGTPRRAGVSSFGIGGTNAHVVLEEAPLIEDSGESRPWQMLLLSAKTSSALETATTNLVEHLKQNSALNLADVAHTLQVGRKAFNHRRMVVCSNLEDTVNALSNLDLKRVFTSTQDAKERPVVFMFSGQGSQYVKMAFELYEKEPTFRDCINQCSEILKPYLKLDLRHVLYPKDEQIEEATLQLKQTAITQPALFTIEYALSQLWLEWGVRPTAMIGHSIGEYVAACLAGVFSLEDALALVAKRGQLMQQMPPGSMLAVPLPENEVQPLLGDKLSLAVINGQSSCVVAGTADAIEGLQQKLLDQGVECRCLHTSHAFHSQMMEPILEPFEELVKKVALKPPQMPYISNVTGTWITAAQATNPSYWATHLRQTVRFADGLQELLKKPEQILLEIGPGRTLTTLAKQHPDCTADRIVLSSLRHPQDGQSDLAFLLTTFGKLWLTGIQVNWSGFYAYERRYRLPLPTYPFERQRHWIEAKSLPAQNTPISNPILWESLVEAGLMQSQIGIEKFDNSTYLEKKQSLDRLCIAYMNLALQNLGAFSNPSQGYSLEELFHQFQVLPRYQQLLSGWLKVLVTQGQLKQEGEKFTNFIPFPKNSLNALVEQVRIQWQDNLQWIDTIQICGENLAAVLLGKEDPLALTFTGGSFDKMENLAQEWPVFHYCNGIVRASLQQVVKSLSPQVNLRILEIGAGMGLTTVDIMPILPPKQTSYTFTDVGRLFLDRGKEKFSAYPFVDYRLLDIEQPPENQGYEPHSFDVIIAANVLHVTRNIGETLAHARSLLAPEGIVLIWEITQHQLDFDIVDGLAMRPLADGERSQGNPFLSKEQWFEALRDNGFVEMTALPETEALGHHILVAKASSPAANSAPLAFTVSQEKILSNQVTTGKKPNIADWFYIPSWKRSLLPARKANLLPAQSCWLVFADECGLGDKIVKHLEQENQDVITVKVGQEFASQGNGVYTLNPQQSEDYNTLVTELSTQNKTPKTIVHLWNVTPEDSTELGIQLLDNSQNLGFYSLMFLAQAIGKQNLTDELQIGVVSNNIQEVTGEEVLFPEKATVLGPCKVIPQEYPNITCQNIDVVLPNSGSRQEEKLISDLLAELRTKPSELSVAYRGNHRWVQTFEPMQLDGTLEEIPRLKEGGVYLITGGLGGIGLELAEYLAQTVRAKLVLIGRSPIPESNQWEQWLSNHDEQDSVSRKIRKLQAIKKLGAEVLVIAADVANLEQMQKAIAQACEQFDTIDGAIHAAGIAPAGMIQLKTPEMIENLLAPKVKGTLILDALLKDFNLDFLVLCSSLNSILATMGLVDHCAANAFLDAFAQRNTNRNGTFTVSINWDGWQEVGQAANTMMPAELEKWREESLKHAILPKEGVDAFSRIVKTALPQVLVSTQDFLMLIEQHHASKGSLFLEAIQKANPSKLIESRPELKNAYLAPRNSLEKTISGIWQKCLGVEGLGIHDDFFELGGDSLLAVHLLSKLSESTKTKLSPHSLLKAPTIAALAELIEETSSAQKLTNRPGNKALPPSLVEIQTGIKQPLFLVHPAGGQIYVYRDLAHHLGSDQPVYGLQSQSADEETDAFLCVEEMAANYVDTLRVVQPEGPYLLGGSSFGGTVAFEMAQQLEAQGQKVALLALIDTPGWGYMPAGHIEDSVVKIMAYLLGLGANVSNSLDRLQQLGTEEQLRYFLEQGKAALRLPDGFGLSELRQYHQLFKGHVQAMRNYIPQAYSGQVIFFRAGERDAFNPPNPELGWINLAAGGLQIHEVPGNHITMHFPPHVQVIAEQLKAYLNEAAVG